MNKDTMRAVILGVACGDALGAPTEFMHMSGIRRRFGRDGITELSQTNGHYTDDTQMMVALTEGLLAAHGAVAFERRDAKLLGHPVCTADMTDEEFVMPHVAKRFVAWSKSPENNRSPGSTCMGGCRNLAKGMYWRESGLPRPGCGGMMRVAPVGLLYTTSEYVLRMAKAQCICTHSAPSAYQAAQLTALAVHLLAERKVEPRELIEKLCYLAGFHNKLVGNLDSKLADLLGRVHGAIDLVLEDEDTPHEIQRRYEDGPKNLGESWHGDEALASALFCFLLACERGEGYKEAVRYGANTDGDSDSIACIAGAFAGAHWGLGERGVPADWIAHVEDSFTLRALADRLAEVSL